MPIIEIYQLYLVKINSFQLISICFSAQHPPHMLQDNLTGWSCCLNIKNTFVHYLPLNCFGHQKELKFLTKKVEKRCLTIKPIFEPLIKKISIRNIFYILSSFATPHWHYPSDILDPSFG